MKKINLIGKSLLKWFVSLNLSSILILLFFAGIIIMKNPNLTEVKIENQAINQLITILSTLCGFYIFNKSMNEKIEIKKEKLNIKNIVIYSLILISIGNIGEYFVKFLNLLLNKVGYDFNIAAYNNVFAANNIIDYLMILISVVIVAPIVEELMYRFILNNSLKEYGKLSSLIVSSFLFGIVHCQFYQIMPAMAAGIILSLIYFKTNDIRYSIIVHMLNNLTATLLMFFNINNHIVNISLIILGLAFLFFKNDLLSVPMKNNGFKYNWLLKSFPLVMFLIICIIITFGQLTKI